MGVTFVMTKVIMENIHWISTIYVNLILHCAIEDNKNNEEVSTGDPKHGRTRNKMLFHEERKIIIWLACCILINIC